MTTAAPARRQSADTKNSGRGSLKTRTQQILQTEIAFIPNRNFPKIDGDPETRDQLLAPPTSRTDAEDARSGRLKMPAHLERICAAPLLSPAEERDLFCRMNYLKYRANTIRSRLDENRPSRARITEVESLLANATTVRNLIVQANTRLVVSIVKHYADDMNPFDDLLSEGIACLINAVEKFDFDRGFRFSTYATRAVRREVFRLVQRTHRSRSRFTTGTSDVLNQQLDADCDNGRTESYLTKVNRCIAKLVRNLDEREQFIVSARYGFIDLGVKPTFTRLGEHLGVSKERVRQLEARAMGKLRDSMGDFRIEPTIGS